MVVKALGRIKCSGFVVSAGPRFANVKIDSASLERILPSRDGTYILNRIRGELGFQPI
ncbi:hypothetical protein MOV75_09055 [Bradyrhizobium sp. PRIMUS42]|nr:hypothetical protein [Bradyrhizobium sp. PRIMUS42]